MTTHEPDTRSPAATRLLRRMARAPVRGENYFKAEITAGRVGQEQTSPRREFV